MTAGTIPILDKHVFSRDYSDMKAIHDEIVEAMRSKEEKQLRRIFSEALGHEFTQADANRFRIVSVIGSHDYHVMFDGRKICQVTTKMKNGSDGSVTITTYFE